jgi:hypothetical protein
MRFSIRDLLWATLVAAMGLGWWVSYRTIDGERLEAVEQAHKLDDAVRNTRHLVGVFKANTVKGEYMLFALTEVEKTLKPAVEP